MYTALVSHVLPNYIVAKNKPAWVASMRELCISYVRFV